MISLADITKTIVRRSHGMTDRQPMHATREWAIGLSGAVLIVLVGSFYLWTLYHSYRNTTFIDSAEGNDTAIYQADVVNRATTIIFERQQTFQTLLSSIDTNTVNDTDRVETSTTTTSTSTTTEMLSTESTNEAVATSRADNVLLESEDELNDIQLVP
jgi:hypothetical protein